MASSLQTGQVQHKTKTNSHHPSIVPINHAQYDTCTWPQLSNAMWYHPQGNSLSMSTRHSHLEKLGNKCRDHPVVHMLPVILFKIFLYLSSSTWCWVPTFDIIVFTGLLEADWLSITLNSTSSNCTLTRILRANDSNHNYTIKTLLMTTFNTHLLCKSLALVFSLLFFCLLYLAAFQNLWVSLIS